MKKPLLYKRILIKLSGEAFGRVGEGIDVKVLAATAREIASIQKLDVEVAITVGGGNLWRKRDKSNEIETRTSDYLGLLATVMNGLVLRQAFQKLRVPCMLFSAVAYDIPLAHKFDGVLARGALRRGEIVIFSGGTGSPGFTTDTGAALRARDIHADVVIKVGVVDGVYTANPRKVRSAKKYATVTMAEALKKKLGIMDKEAFEICQQRKIPIVVCKWGKGVVQRVVAGERVGTLVTP